MSTAEEIELWERARNVAGYYEEIGRCYQDGGCDKCHANLAEAIERLDEATHLALPA